MKTIVVYVKTPGAGQRISACAAETDLPQKVKVVDCAPALFLELSLGRVDVVLVDVALAAPDPVKFTRTVRTRFPATGLVFTGAASPRTAAMLAAAGALGVMRAMTGDGDDLLVAFAQTVVLARRRLTNTTSSVPRQRPPRPALKALSDREFQILTALTEGKRNAEIAIDLFVSEDTVKTHAKHLYRKLGARDRAHAVAIAFRTGLLT
ncbi:response regulator transcription factor [Glycomyces rhizosphaerae]|uniref:Response regulator transcription factor n=1 Tax=Glycomyces rhizosphaerae TaxID=2054422 RepID=A0ABV7PZB1_9ACTN